MEVLTNTGKQDQDSLLDVQQVQKLVPSHLDFFKCNYFSGAICASKLHWKPILQSSVMQKRNLDDHEEAWILHEKVHVEVSHPALVQSLKPWRKHLCCEIRIWDQIVATWSWQWGSWAAEVVRVVMYCPSMCPNPIGASGSSDSMSLTMQTRNPVLNADARRTPMPNIDMVKSTLEYWFYRAKINWPQNSNY